MTSKIKLSKRLSTIAKMVDHSSSLADVGCDHALLDIYLSQNDIIKKAVACDITENALKGALKNLLKSNVKNVTLRISDGLSKITSEDKIDTLVISGLGGNKIISILNDGKEKLNKISTIILAPNTDVSKVRKKLLEIGYFIEDEKLVKERKIIYTVIKFKKGLKKYNSKQIYLGPVLLKNKDDLFNEAILDIVNKNKRIIKNLPSYMLFKKIRLIITNLKLKKEMNRKTN